MNNSKIEEKLRNSLEYFEDVFIRLNYLFIGFVFMLFATSVITNLNTRLPLINTASIVFIFILWFKTLVKMIYEEEHLEAIYIEKDKTEIHNDICSYLGITKDYYNLRFVDYIKSYHVKHPYITISIIGLIVAKYYFPDFELTRNFFRFSFVSIPYICLLHILDGYLKFINNNIIRRTIRIFILINTPLMLAGFIFGFVSFFLLPMISVVHSLLLNGTFDFIIHWVGQGINSLILVLIHFILFDSIKNKIIEEIDDSLRRLNEKDMAI